MELHNGNKSRMGEDREPGVEGKAAEAFENKQKLKVRDFDGEFTSTS